MKTALSYIPPITIQNGLKRYIEDGILPGSFLSAVLQNDLIHTIAYADEENANHLVELIAYIWGNVPSEIWGSKQAVETYILYKRDQRDNKKFGIDCI